MSKFSLIGKTAIVTGGASGIGKAISKIFAEQGAKVHILDINKEGATQTANEIRKANQIAIAHCCDVSNQKNVNEIIKKITTTDAINILVNNAGIAHIGSIEKTREEDLDRLYADNFIKNEGWYPVDISEADKNKDKKGYFFGTAPADRVEMMVGRDFILEGYDEETVNLFIYPLLEIDDDPSTSFTKNFSYKDI